MALVLLVALGLGWFVHLVQVQRDAVAAIERAGGKAFYDWQLKLLTTPDFDDLGMNPGGRPPWPKWLVDRLGPDYYSTVKLVMVPGEADPIMPDVGRLQHLEEITFIPRRPTLAYGPTDAGMAHLRGLTRLRHLRVGAGTGDGAVGSKITGAGLASIASATRMQILNIAGIPLVDADLAALSGMTDLRVLEIQGSGITDAGLDHLARLVGMRKLDLQGTRVTAAGLVQLRDMTRLNNLNLALTRVESLEPCRPMASLRTLTLARTPITDAGLAPASDPGFAALTNLSLYQTRVGDEGLMHLRDIPKLRSIALGGTAVTAVGVAEFKKTRPTVNADIVDRAVAKGATTKRATKKTPAPTGK